MNQKRTRHIILGTVIFFLLMFLLSPGRSTTVQAAANDNETVQIKLAEGVYRYDYAYQMLEIVNQERAKYNQAPLVMDQKLLEHAMQRSAEISVRFSHSRPNGYGYGYQSGCSILSENLAITPNNDNPPAQAMDNLMSDGPHSAAIISYQHVSVGIGCFYQSGRYYWAQEFSTESAEAYSQPANRTVTPVVNTQPRFLNAHFLEATPLTFTEGSKTINLYLSCLDSFYVKLDPSNFLWQSEDSSVATISQTGVIQLKKAGDISVTATLKVCPSISVTIPLNAYYDLENSSEVIVHYTNSYNYTGKEINVSPSISFHGRTLTEGVDYSLSIDNNINAGTAHMTMKGLGLYRGTLYYNYYIDPIPLSDLTLSLPQSTFYYDGEPITPKPTITWNGTELVEGKDYTLSWIDNNQQGNAYVLVQLCGNFTGEKYMTFYIDNISIHDAVIGDIPPFTYTGQPCTPEPTVTYNGQVLQKDVDYILTYVNNINVNSMYSRPRVQVNGIGKYKNGPVKEFTINPVTVSGETFQLPNAKYGDENSTDFLQNNLIIMYNGSRLPSDSFTVTSALMSADKEILLFSISYSGNYTGTSHNFTSVKRCNISTISDQTYSGKPVTPEITIRNGSYVLKEGTDYTLSWENNTEPGTASVTITGMQDYFGSAALNFQIVKPAPPDTPSPEPTKPAVTPTPEPTKPAVTPTPEPTKPAVTPTPEPTKPAVTPTPEPTKPAATPSPSPAPTKPAATPSPSPTKPAATPSPSPVPTKPAATPSPSPAPAKPAATPSPSPTPTKPTSTPAPAKPATTPALQTTSAWNKVTLRWTAVDNAKNYIIYKKTGSGAYKKLKTVKSNVLSYQDKKINVGTTYQYRVRAVLKTGANSPYSATIKVRPTLSRPNLVLKTKKRKQTLSWKKVSGANGYILYQQTGKGKFKKIKTLSAKTTRYTVRTKKGVTYSYKVVPYRTVSKKTKMGTASLIKKGKAK